VQPYSTSADPNLVSRADPNLISRAPPNPNLVVARVAKICAQHYTTVLSRYEECGVVTLPHG
jgi:hypothetical protein